MKKINQREIDWKEYERENSDFRRKELSSSVKTTGLGCSLYELPSEGQSWPYHYHTANEEAIFVLAGNGQVRSEEGKHSLEAGDFATFPADESGGHQIINDGEETLRYLMVSTMNDPDVTVYPEMEKFGVFVGSPPGGREDRSLHGFYKLGNQVDYWPTE